MRHEALDAAMLRHGTLAAAAAPRGILFGTCLEPYQYNKYPEYASVVARECSQIVPQNSLKATATRKSPDTFDFSVAEELVSFASSNNLSVRGHTLIWNRFPDWIPSSILTAKQAKEELFLEVTEPVRHFRGRLDSWDVVNEPIGIWDKQRNLLSNNLWYKFIGPDYIRMAFSAAREADPNTLLVLNEGGIECDTPAGERKRNALMTLLRSLRQEGVPIDALGIQSHLGAGDKYAFTADVFRGFLHDVQSLNLKILITELDYSDSMAPADVKTRDAMAASSIRSFLDVVLAEPGVITVNVWGLTDRYSWLAGYLPRMDGLPVRPCLLDSNLARKPAYYSVRMAFDAATSG